MGKGLIWYYKINEKWSKLASSLSLYSNHGWRTALLQLGKIPVEISRLSIMQMFFNDYRDLISDILINDADSVD